MALYLVAFYSVDGFIAFTVQPIEKHVHMGEWSHLVCES